MLPLVLSLVVGQCVSSCPDDWVELAEHCYVWPTARKFFFYWPVFLLAFFYWPTARKSWREAEIHCNSFGGHLASVPNMEVNNLIQSRVKKNDPKTHFWLGGRKKEGDWSWSDESRWNFTRWLWSGSGKKEQCLQILESGGWNDLPCNYHRQFVCGQRISLGEHSVPIQIIFSRHIHFHC